MPIDSSIAMGYQPIKLENPLNSLAQMMQIQNAQSQNRLADLTFAQHQQEQENKNALNAAYASSIGADGRIDRTKLLQSLASSKLGSHIPAVQKSFLETDEAEGKVNKGKLELFDTAMKQRRDALAGVTSAEEYLAWHQGNHSDPILGPLLAARGVKPGDALPQVEAALKQPDGLKNLITQSALGMTKFAELNKPSIHSVSSGKVSTMYAVPGMGGAPTVVNTTQMTTTPGEDLRSKDAEKSRAQAERHFQVTQANTKVPSGYRLAKDGVSLEAIPGGPADLKAQAVAGAKATGAADVDSAIAVLRDAYDRLESGGGITSTNKGPLDNTAAAISSSGIGQVVGRTLGTNNQSARNDIAMSRPALLAAMMKATGMSAKQMDSNAELKMWMATATDPTLDVESNRRALDNIERKYLSSQGTPKEVPTNPQDAQALEWANSNPNDPRAKAIKQRLGVK